MMYLIGAITLMVIVSTVLLQWKIKRQAKQIKELKFEVTQLKAQSEINNLASEAKQEILVGQVKQDQKTATIAKTIPSKTQELSDEEKIIANNITSNFND